MRKTSIILATVGLLVLLASLVPWPARRAVPSGTGVTVGAAASVERGRMLFTVKGCIGCHRHDGVTVTQDMVLPVGPDLTGYTADPNFLESWLKNPAAIRPRTQMPNLELSAEEIDLLIAFLNADDSP